MGRVFGVVVGAVTVDRRMKRTTSDTSHKPLLVVPPLPIVPGVSWCFIVIELTTESHRSRKTPTDRKGGLCGQG